MLWNNHYLSVHVVSNGELIFYFMHWFCSLLWNVAVSQRWSLTTAPGMSRPPAFITFSGNLFRLRPVSFASNVSRLESQVKKPHGAFSLQWLENRSMVWWCQDVPRKFVGVSCCELSQTQMHANNFNKCVATAFWIQHFELKGTDKREYYLGEEAIAKRGVLTLSYPASALKKHNVPLGICVPVHIVCLEV